MNKMIESSYFSNKPTYYQMIGKTLKIVNFIDIETKFENYNSYLYFSLSFFHPLYLTIYLSHFLFLSFFLFFFFLSSFSPSLSLSLSLSLFNMKLSWIKGGIRTCGFLLIFTVVFRVFLAPAGHSLTLT